MPAQTCNGTDRRFRFLIQF